MWLTVAVDEWRAVVLALGWCSHMETDFQQVNRQERETDKSTHLFKHREKKQKLNDKGWNQTISLNLNVNIISHISLSVSLLSVFGYFRCVYWLTGKESLVFLLVRRGDLPGCPSVKCWFIIAGSLKKQEENYDTIAVLVLVLFISYSEAAYVHITTMVNTYLLTCLSMRELPQKQGLDRAWKIKSFFSHF